KTFIILILFAFQCFSTFSQERESIININESDLKFLINNAEKGDPEAQFELGTRYYKGYSVNIDYEKSAYWTEKSAEQGVHDAQYAIGMYYSKGTGVSKDLKKAMYWYEKSALQENKYAEYQLGYIYENGIGVEVDYVKAANWYEKSAIKGMEFAQIKIGKMYFLGKGVQTTGIVYHLQRIKLSIAQWVKVNHLERMKVNH